MATFAEQVAAAKAKMDADKIIYDADVAAYQALIAQAVADGPDVSQFQGDIDWVKVKAVPSGFAFVRNADGDVNDTFYTAARVTSLRSAGLPFSPYQFARVANPNNNERDGKTEAAMAYYFARRQGWGQVGDLPIMYDFENDSLMGQPAAKCAAHVVAAVRTLRMLMGVPCIFYTNPSTMAAILPALDSAGLAELAQCPLHIAHWDVATPTVPKPWSTWTFWQYTNKGALSGISTPPVDLNKFSGSKTDLEGLKLQ